MSEKNIQQQSSEDAIADLKPNKIYFLDSLSGDFSDELRVLDLSSAVATGGYVGNLTKAFTKDVQQVAKVRKNESSTWAFELGRKTFSSKMQFHDAKAGGNVVAELDMAILKQWGAWAMSFPEQSPHSSHDIEIRPVGIWKKEETFVKDSISYLWDLSGPGKSGKLYQVKDEKKVLVAEFVAKRWFVNNCVLVLDSELLDEVVVLASCVAVLNRQT